MKWSVAAAFLLVVIGGVFIFSTTHRGRRVIRKYRTDSSGSYITPSPGETVFTSEVRAARKRYNGRNVAYLLSFEMFKKDSEDQLVGLSEEERTEEYRRLLSMGYELCTAECWTYQGKGQKRYYTVVAGYFTEGELALFRGNPEYGYFFEDAGFCGAFGKA